MKINFRNIIDGSIHSEPVASIATLLSNIIDLNCVAILNGNAIEIPPYEDETIQKLVEYLWTNKNLNIPRYFSSPEIKQLLIADAFHRVTEAAYSGTAFYDIFSESSQKLLSDFLGALPKPHITAFKGTIQKCIQSLKPLSYSSEYEYILAYSFLLILAPLFKKTEYKVLDRLGGIRIERRNISHLTIKFISKLYELYRFTDSSDFFQYYLQNIQLGVISQFEFDIDRINSKATPISDTEPDIFLYILEKLPPNALIYVASILCPLLFCEHIFTRLHILCRILWAPLDIYPERFLHNWLPRGFIDILINSDSKIKEQSLVLQIPRTVREQKFKQVNEILRKVSERCLLDLTPTVSHLLKYQVYNTILYPLIVQLSYNKALLSQLDDSAICKNIGNALYSKFKQLSLSDESIREILLNGSIDNFKVENTHENINTLMDIREDIVQNLFIKD